MREPSPYLREQARRCFPFLYFLSLRRRSKFLWPKGFERLSRAEVILRRKGRSE